MIYFLLSVFGGVLTVLSPCVLPLLPIIVGGSLAEGKTWKKPLIITLSLALSITIFTLLLKVTTLFIDIPQIFWQIFSGVLVVILGLAFLFPDLWTKISTSAGAEGASQEWLKKASKKEGNTKSILIGMALGPVFASCSPVYFLILGTILPLSFFQGLIDLLAYSLSLSFMMFLIALGGRRMVQKFQGAADSRGNFKKTIGILFIIIGLLVGTGYMKDAEAWLLSQSWFPNVTQIEQGLLEKFSPTEELITPSSKSAGKNVDSNADEESQDSAQKISDLSPKAQKMLAHSILAPDLVGLKNWINSAPINSLKNLRGKVVIIDFWTYSCINCIRTLPYVQSWHEKYAQKGLVILGIHAPEFQFEKKLENVKNAAEKYGLTYPIAQDNDFQTWRAYSNRYWPAKYIIDQEGLLRGYHFGEGDYEETEEVIQFLLGLDNQGNEIAKNPVKNYDRQQTHETYLGLNRRENFLSGAEELDRHQWSLLGSWSADEEKIWTNTFPSSIRMNFYAAEANIVLGGVGELEVWIDGKKSADISVDGEDLYNVFKGERGEYDMELRFNSEEKIEAYAWTFG